MRITVRDLMVPAAAVAEGSTSVAAARDLMLRWKAEEAYVVDHAGKLLGVVPDYEFLKAELAGASGAAAVKSLMSTRVEAVDADADVATVLTKFREGWCGRIAVTQKGRLVGRLTRSEVLRLVIHLRQIASVNEAVAEEATLRGPHFRPRKEKLAPVRKMSKGAKMSKSSGGRRVRRLAAG